MMTMMTIAVKVDPVEVVGEWSGCIQMHANKGGETVSSMPQGRANAMTTRPKTMTVLMTMITTKPPPKQICPTQCTFLIRFHLKQTIISTVKIISWETILQATTNQSTQQEL